MLGQFLIFSLFIVAIRASGELTLLNVPSSLSFKGEEPLLSKHVGDVFDAISGNAVANDVVWSALTINDPFELPKRIVAVYVDGARHLSINDEAKSYALQGSDSEESLSVYSAQLQAGTGGVCNLNLKHPKEAEANYMLLFGKSSTLNADQKKSTQQATFIENIANNWQNLQDECQFFWVRASVDDPESAKVFGAVIAKLNAAIQKTSGKDTLVVAIANKAARVKREALSPDTKTNKYNLAKNYGEDYPAIFNIIFWFMIVFFLSLLAICYALAYMDPGRDSIIYRMTSTRMKKDN